MSLDPHAPSPPPPPTNPTGLTSATNAPAPVASAGKTPAEAFLLRTAELLHRHGTPSYRLERVMTRASQSLGIDSTYLYTPTALIVSIVREEGEQTYLRRIDSGEVDVSKLIEFDRVLHDMEVGKLTIAEATQRLDEAAAAEPPYGFATTIAAAGVACGTVAILFRGGVTEVGVAAVLGCLLACLTWFTVRAGWDRGVLEPLAGFSVGLLTLWISHYVLPIDDRLTTLAALILPLPGLTLTIALTELAMGHLSAGSARLAGASVTLLTLILGVAIAWRLGPSGNTIIGQAAVISMPLPAWSLWIALGLAPGAFAILFKAPLSQWPVIFAVSILGFLLARWLGRSVAPEVGSFCGALAVGVGSNLYARLKNRPAMVAQTPGLLILVPGSIGYRSLTALLEHQTVEGVELAFAMVLLAMSLVGGLLSANVILPLRRVL
ncbi:threonine/serine exporter family protein [Candidatus Laterigemmans baculatus]|uniref:threonine/serine ThrE exporter family protein n=1 Tax=Candidatus Laterigemmans baculatus TaxID=2770505 RepID=UPI0013DACC0C|nr:threonine/serine exporter family protein [Candidatus Laterigemmans baculatus]